MVCLFYFIFVFCVLLSLFIIIIYFVFRKIKENDKLTIYLIGQSLLGPGFVAAMTDETVVIGEYDNILQQALAILTVEEVAQDIRDSGN